MESEEKQRLREKMKGEIRRMLPQEREFFSRRIAAALSAEKAWCSAARVFGFFPLKGEPDWLSALLEGQALYLPKIFGETMRYYRVRELEGLSKNALGVREPGEGGEEGEPAEGDVLLVPGLAFSLDGGRLGRGRGYYDRYLRENFVEAWGVCFPFQVVAQLPMEQHDMRVCRLFSGEEKRDF